MRCSNPITFFNSIFKCSFTSYFGAREIHIEINGYGGVGKLNGASMHHIAPKYQFLPFTFKYVKTFAWCMPKRRRGGDSGKQLSARFKGFNFSCLLVRSYGSLCSIEKRLCPFVGRL